jgi:hypothetical protein
MADSGAASPDGDGPEGRGWLVAADCADDTNEDDDEEDEDEDEEDEDEDEEDEDEEEDEQGTKCSEPKSREVLAAVGASAGTYAGARDDAGTKPGVGAGTYAGT